MQPELFGIPTYFIYLSALFSGLVVALPWWAKKQNQDVLQALNIGLILMVMGFIGARLFHVLYESPEIYKQDPALIFAFWTGGFVFYGGAITAFVAATAYVKIKNLDFLSWADFWAPIVALGYGLGRVACLLAGCCYGRSCDLPWAIGGRHPTQIYAMISELIVFAILILLIPIFKKSPQKKGMLFLLWLVLHTSGRLLMEYFREDFRGDFYAGLSISSWISLVILSIALAGLMKFYLQARQKTE